MYNNLNPKYKSFLFFLVKLTIVVGSLYFIYDKVVHNSQLKFSEFHQQIKLILLNDSITSLILLIFTFFNWFFEIWKWKILTNTIKRNSFFEATKQSLAALTTSLFTPNRIGDYGAKAIYFPKMKGKIILLNLIGNLNQLTITILFGITGLIYFLSTYDVEINPHRVRIIGYFIGFLALLLIPKKSRKVKLFSFLKFDKLKEFIKKTSLKIHFKIVVLSLIRYAIFSHQFYYLLMIFGVEIEYSTLMYLIFTMYFLASFIPSISLFDWAVKGSVAIYIFAFAGISEITIVTITLLMWILNFAIPSLIGSFFVINFKFSKE
ncbi:MAG: flippase-like domain-containing protein [Flavobacteriaceae bacterium]|nr:flippase-like domain-containing protein [Flavobacteriaceae bacterium]